MIKKTIFCSILFLFNAFAQQQQTVFVDKVPYSERSIHNYYSNPLVADRMLVYTLIGGGVPYKDRLYGFPTISGTLSVGCRKALGLIPAFDSSFEYGLSSSRMRAGVQLAFLGFPDPEHKSAYFGVGFRTGWEQLQGPWKTVKNKGYWDIPLVLGVHFNLKYLDAIPILQFRISMKETDLSCGTAF